LLLVAAAVMPTTHAQKKHGPPPPVPFSDAAIFVELNDTDGDLGLHASIDGQTWLNLEVEDPNGQLLLSLRARGHLREQGMTQLAFESAEPTFDELDPADFFARFPEGAYEIEARGQDGEKIESTSVLSHVMAAPPDNVLVSGVPKAENCDATPLPTVHAPVVIDWDPVTLSHPTIGTAGQIPVTISRYQLFVERGGGSSLAVDLPPNVTEFEVPASLSAPGHVKFEIIARTSTGNNTAIESCFIIQ
jgi:hypothetical protein